MMPIQMFGAGHRCRSYSCALKQGQAPSAIRETSFLKANRYLQNRQVADPRRLSDDRPAGHGFALV